MNKSDNKILINVFLLLLTSLLTILSVEFFLRFIDKPNWVYGNGIQAGFGIQLSKSRNDLGYRGQRFNYSDNNIIIILLGDSQVSSWACPSEKIPEQLLENHLKSIDPRFKVFSIGNSGYGTDLQYLALKNYFIKYRADAVILWQTFKNDIWNNIFPTHWSKDGAIKPTFWLEDSILKGPNYQLGEFVRKPAKTKIGVLVNRLINRLFPPNRGLDASWEKYLPKPYEPLTHYNGEFLTDWDPNDKSHKNPVLNENFKNEKAHLAVNLYPRSDRMQYGLDLTRKLLGKVNELVIDNDSKFFIFHTFLPKEKYDSRTEDEIIVHKRNNLYYKSSLKQREDNQKYVNEGFNLFKIPILIKNWKVDERDSHLNCEANDQVMRLLSDNITKSIRFNEK